MFPWTAQNEIFRKTFRLLSLMDKCINNTSVLSGFFIRSQVIDWNSRDNRKQRQMSPEHIFTKHITGQSTCCVLRLLIQILHVSLIFWFLSFSVCVEQMHSTLFILRLFCYLSGAAGLYVKKKKHPLTFVCALFLMCTTYDRSCAILLSHPFSQIRSRTAQMCTNL